MLNQAEHFNQMEPYPDTASMIAEKIGSYYHVLQERKELHQLIRDVAEEKLLEHYMDEHYEEDLEEINELLEDGQISENEAEEMVENLRKKALFNIDSFYKFDDVLLGYKSRATKVWDESFNEVLREKKLLPLVKTVLKKDELRYNIASFTRPNEKYLKIHESLNMSKEEKAMANEEAKELLKAQKKQLQLKSMDEIILLFKNNKEALKTLENIYEKDRKDLFELMTKEELTEVPANEEGTLFFKIFERSGGYDTTEIANNDIEKKFVYFYAVKSDGSVECKDWFSGETFTFTVDTTHNGHRLSYKDEVLYVDGAALTTPNLADVSLLKKSDYKEIEKLKWNVAYGTLKIPGLDFLENCKTSSTLVEKLIADGELSPSVLDEYRYIENEQSIKLVFEMIEEDSDNNRKFFFVKKRQKQAAQYEKRRSREA